MHRFFIHPDQFNSKEVIFTDDIAHQISRVLRFKTGDQVIVLDNSGFEYIVTLNLTNSNHVKGLITDKMRSFTEPRIKITLYQSVLKADKFELVLQKGTELGVSVFSPTHFSRSNTASKIAQWPNKRSKRWQKIIREAAEQSRRGRLPLLDQPADFEHVTKSLNGLSIMPYEHESDTTLKEILINWCYKENANNINIFIGPEGGLTSDEIEHATDNGIIPVTLGPRILRSETAGLITSSIILYQLGDLSRVDP